MFPQFLLLCLVTPTCSLFPSSHLSPVFSSAPVYLISQSSPHLQSGIVCHTCHIWFASRFAILFSDCSHISLLLCLIKFNRCFTQVLHACLYSWVIQLRQSQSLAPEQTANSNIHKCTHRKTQSKVDRLLAYVWQHVYLHFSQSN